MPGLDQAAAGDDRDPVADQLDLAQQVRVEQNGDAATAQLLEQAADDAAPDRVEGAGRLVEQQQPRRADQRLGDAQPLLHPLRHRLHPLVPRLAEPDKVEQLAPARSRRRPSRRGAGAAAAARRPSTSPGSETAPPDSRGPRGPAANRPARPSTSTPPPLGRTRPQAILVRVDLPAPLGPSSPTSSPRPDLQVDPRQRLLSPVALAQAGDRENRGLHQLGGSIFGNSGRNPLDALAAGAGAELGQLACRLRPAPPAASRSCAAGKGGAAASSTRRPSTRL